MGHLHGVGGPARRTLTLRAANCRVGSYYAAGAAALLALVPATWPWGVFLLWPAAALAFVAFAYFGGGPGVFCKTDGRLPLSTRFVLAPILLGQYLSLVCYRRRCRAWDEMTPAVLVGRVLSEAEAAALLERGVMAVLDLTAEFSETAALRTANYRNLPVLDLTAPWSSLPRRRLAAPCTCTRAKPPRLTSPRRRPPASLRPRTTLSGRR